MKTPSDRNELLNEVLTVENASKLRAKSLEVTLTAVRRQRRLRHALRCASPIVALGILTAALWYRQAPSIQPVAVQPAVIAAPTVPGTSIRLLSDEELLAMFPDRPVALIGPPDERQFVFLDEKRNSRSRGTHSIKAHNL